ncbi:hypothetical protein IFDJLNFL_5551 [Methylobacterium dankookense]|uniref:Uncharacterized protein n=1 Tax=Methylobacterium dankookense TaxID=560405 RepID=A0ABQ4RP89_9HYPH|nr:hypothetical protein IFDJLNFL_5551 [Methylobacterium dankookense]
MSGVIIHRDQVRPETMASEVSAKQKGGSSHHSGERWMGTSFSPARSFRPIRQRFMSTCGSWCSARVSTVLQKWCFSRLVPGSISTGSRGSGPYRL